MLEKMSKLFVKALQSLLMLMAVVLVGRLLTPEVAFATIGDGCIGCHAEAVESFTTSYHGRANKNLVTTDCQSCHGPTGKHMESGDPADIFSYSISHKAEKADLNKQCLKCHKRDTNLAYWDMGGHARNEVHCTACHGIHVAKYQIDQMNVCLRCHRDIRTDTQKMSHHPLREGKIQCKDCHNPHGTMDRNMIKAETTNQLCYKCHADKRGPFVYAHPPVEENCSICHTSHGSRHANLLVQKVPNICQDCHDWSRHPRTPYDAKNGFEGSTPSNRFFARSCLNCHGAIHGSSNFEYHGLTR
jgi:DmsE family decaheme c-type cytochrome